MEGRMREDKFCARCGSNGKLDENFHCSTCYAELSATNKRLQSTITKQDEIIKRYQSLMSLHIVGTCPKCNYMASWPVCTKCGTPYPDSGSEKDRQ